MRHIKIFLTLALTIAMGLCLAGSSWALSAAEEADLSHMRQEEKLARDVYQELYDRHGLAIFANIASSEQRHMDAIKTVLDMYGLPDPVSDDSRGVYEDGDFTQLYQDLTAQGSASLTAALGMGCTIEDLDILDLQLAQTRTGEAAILRVYQSLERGSRNHLRSFYAVLTAYGETYTAQYISQSELESIVDGPLENQNGNGPNGRGAGGR